MKTSPVFFGATKTSKAALSELIDDLIHQHMFRLVWASRRAAQARATNNAGTWTALPYHLWAVIAEARDHARAFFTRLRSRLSPTDYRAALTVARRINNETHRTWAERAKEAAAEKKEAA